MEKCENILPGPYNVKMYAAPAVTIIEQDGLYSAVKGDALEARKKYLEGEVSRWYSNYEYAIAALYDPSGIMYYNHGKRDRDVAQYNKAVAARHDGSYKCGLDTVTVELLARRMWYGGVRNMCLGGKTVEVTAMHIIDWMQEKGYITKTSPVEKYFCGENSEHPIVYEYRPDELHLAILEEESDYITNEIQKDYERNH